MCSSRQHILPIHFRDRKGWIPRKVNYEFIPANLVMRSTALLLVDEECVQHLKR